MYIATVGLHIIVCMALILIVLLQTGKGAEMGAGLRGSSQTIFGGSSGTTFLGKLTTGAAVVFMITCLILNLIGEGPASSRSVTENAPAEAPRGPVIPEAMPVPAPGATPAPPIGGSQTQETPAVPAQPAPSAPVEPQKSEVAPASEQPATATPVAAKPEPEAAKPEAAPVKEAAPAKASEPAKKKQ